MDEKTVFSSIIADERTKNLIREWIKNSEVKYQSFAEVLETMGLKGPFNLEYYGYAESDQFKCETADKNQYVVFLRFYDTDSRAEIWVTDKRKKTKYFTVKSGEIYKDC